jgi:hypothetical protein
VDSSLAGVGYPICCDDSNRGAVPVFCAKVLNLRRSSTRVAAVCAASHVSHDSSVLSKSRKAAAAPCCLDAVGCLVASASAAASARSLAKRSSALALASAAACSAACDA